MNKEIRQLFWWSFLIYMLLGPIQKLADTFDFYQSFGFLFDLKSAIIVSTSIVLFFGMTLGTFIILKNYYPDRRISIISILILLNSVFFIALRYFIQEIVCLKLLGFTNYYGDPTLIYYFFDNLYYGLIFSSIGAVIYLVNRSVESESHLKNMEVEKRNMELSMLRSQINPHFLFNQLNSIYSLVYQKSDKALTAVSNLSDFLRYSLYEKKHKVPLAEELKSIRNYIDLQKIRMDNSVNIILDMPLEPKNIEIQPYIFLPFVENAIKHGQVNDPDHPIKIALDIQNDQLIFTTSNTKSKTQKDESGGIGLESIKRRLSLLYKDQHDLHIEDVPNFYKVHLKINNLA